MIKLYTSWLAESNDNLDGFIVYRGMDKFHDIRKNVWVTDSKKYAKYWANKEYNKNGIVKKYVVPNAVMNKLCDADEFEDLMNDEDEWQEIPDDSPIWEGGDDENYDYDLMHDLCFPSNKQIEILKRNGYSGIAFNYDDYDDCVSIMIFDGNVLKEI